MEEGCCTKRKLEGYIYHGKKGVLQERSLVLVLRVDDVAVLILRLGHVEHTDELGNGDPDSGVGHVTTGAHTTTEAEASEFGILGVGVEGRAIGSHEPLRNELERLRVDFGIMELSPSISEDDGALGEPVAAEFIILLQAVRES
jgi:hypothetical protein